MSDDVIIVGSGASGVAAALRLADRGIRPTILDVGIAAPSNGTLTDNFYQLRRRRDLFQVMIGEDYHRIRVRSQRAQPLPAKLTAPRIAFVTRRGSAPPLRHDGCSVVESFACGGLANAWGAGLYRATDSDLAGWPIRADELTARYDRLTTEIGISGQSDDLAPFFGSAESLQPPLMLSKKASALLARYQRRRERMNTAGVFIGRPRLAVLSRPHAGRPPCDYSNLEFWEPNLPFIYTPRWTLDRMIADGRVDYRGGLFVESWSIRANRIIAHARDVTTGSPVSVSGKTLLLAAGAVGSGRLALASRKDTTSRLGLLDNPAIQLPLVMPRFIGSALETECFGLTQLNLIYRQGDGVETLQGSILEITSPARSEFFDSIPLAARDRLRMIRNLVPAMLVLQLFFPAHCEQAARLSIGQDGGVHLEGPPPLPDMTVIGPIAHLMRKMGAMTHRRLAVVPAAGQQGIHYAGTLPMSIQPAGPYQCDCFGRLAGQDVFVVDGAALPSLPAKNSSFLMMANAMRIADHVADLLRGAA